MFKKNDILSNAVSLALTGTKIRLLSELLVLMFRKKVHPKILCALDKRLIKLRKDFIIAEKRHLLIHSLLDI